LEDQKYHVTLSLMLHQGYIFLLNQLENTKERIIVVISVVEKQSSRFFVQQFSRALDTRVKPTDISQYRLRFGFSLLHTDRVPFIEVH
jgi:hypothetical protein